MLTQNRDFCELVFRDEQPPYGIILVRIPANNCLRKPDRIETLVNDYAEQLAGAVTTLTIANIRVRHLS